MGRLGSGSPRWGLLLAAVLAVILSSSFPAAAQRAAAPAPTEPVTSLFSVRIGGYVQMNVTWDTDENGDDNPSSMRQFAFEPGTVAEHRETLRWAATRTRLFIDVRGPELFGAKTRAYTEFDWDGLKLNENTGAASATAAHTPRLRHAYARFDWPITYLTLGQTTLIFDSAVSSASEVEGVSSGHGDITAGSRNRSPQVILGNVIPIGPAKLEIAGAIGRHATDRQVNADGGINDSGARSGLPAFQGLVKGSIPVFGRDLIAAVSGYWGQETLVASATASGTGSRAFRDVNSEGLAVEALLPLPTFGPITGDIRGAWFIAENMARWNLGNANNGLTSASPTGSPRAIHAWGYWVEGNLELPGKTAVGAGHGFVKDDRDQIIRIGGGDNQPWENNGLWFFAQWKPGPVVIEAMFARVDTTWLVPNTRAERDTHSNEYLLLFRYRF